MQNLLATSKMSAHAYRLFKKDQMRDA